MEQTGPALYQDIDEAAQRLAHGVAEEGGRRLVNMAPAEGAFGRASGSHGLPEPPAPRRAGTRRQMRIHVHSRGFELTEALRVHGERRLLFALSRFGRRVRAVSVALDDLNGARGGIDKRCQIVARLVPWGDVRIEQLDPDLYAAIDRAADRAHHAVAREIERRREMRLLPATRETKERTQ